MVRLIAAIVSVFALSLATMPVNAQVTFNNNPVTTTCDSGSITLLLGDNPFAWPTISPPPPGVLMNPFGDPYGPANGVADVVLWEAIPYGPEANGGGPFPNGIAVEAMCVPDNPNADPEVIVFEGAPNQPNAQALNLAAKPPAAVKQQVIRWKRIPETEWTPKLRAQIERFKESRKKKAERGN